MLLYNVIKAGVMDEKTMVELEGLYDYLYNCELNGLCTNKQVQLSIRKQIVNLISSLHKEIVTGGGE